MTKADLIAAFRARLQTDLDDLRRSRGDATSGTRVDHERPANRGERAAVTSQGYLALGIGQRIAQLEDALVLLDRIDPAPRERVVTGALVELGDGRRVLLLPGGQGALLEGVTVLSPEAPLAKALAGLQAGDVATFRGAELEIVDVG